MYSKNDYIAVFDSGVGGISVLRQLRKVLPGERFVYYGDSANAPYGSRSTEEVRALTFAAVERLTGRFPVKALVVACNTATAAAIEDLRANYSDLIVVGIEPAVKLAADHHPGGNIGVMATQVTLREEKFDLLMNRFNGDRTIYKIPAPGLVELIEAGKGDCEETQVFLRRLLAPYIGKLDALVLGCTHYPFVKHNIQAILGPGTEVLHGGEGTARETKRRLAAADLLERGEGRVEIISSSSDGAMAELAKRLLEQGGRHGF
ncbi:MAG: glutamate racemase [Oscillospiraceae bacterium]|nr:glutamate racemase [Oscillospiraceae bacterium]